MGRKDKVWKKWEAKEGRIRYGRNGKDRKEG